MSRSYECGCASLNDVAIDYQASTDGLDGEHVWSTFPPYTYDKGYGPVCAIKFDVFGITHVDRKRLWCSATMMTVFSDDVPWHRILGATRVRDKVSLWQNGSAQWNDLIELGWLTKWITVHSRPMDWAEGQFNESGRPIYNKPIGHHPERRIVRGGVLDTSKWLLDVQPNELPDYPPAREEPVEQETPLFKFGPPGVGGTPAGDPFRDRSVSPMGPPPAPKRSRSESEDKA